MTTTPNNQEEVDVDELVLRYQKGDKEAGEAILRIYGADPHYDSLQLYVGKYYKLLRYGKIDFKDYDTRIFLSCFFKDREIRSALRQSYQYGHVKKQVRKRLQYVVDSLKVMEDQELKQELRFLLLRQALRYKKTNRSFGGYLYNSYRYAVANFIEDTMKKDEPYIHLYKDMKRVAEDQLEDGDAKIDIKEAVFAKTPMIYFDEEIGNSWVRGLTCGDEFKTLTPLQRLIIKLNYYDGWSDGKIADKMGTHINTIFRQRKKAGRIVRETSERLKQEREQD